MGAERVLIALNINKITCFLHCLKKACSWGYLVRRALAFARFPLSIVKTRETFAPVIAVIHGNTVFTYKTRARRISEARAL